MYNDWEDEEYCEDDCLYSEAFDEWIEENAPELEEGYQKIKEAITVGVTKAIKQDVVNKMKQIAWVGKKNAVLNKTNWELKQKVSDLERFIRDNHIKAKRDIVLYKLTEGMDRCHTCQKCNGKRHLVVTMPTGEKTEITCPECKGKGYTVEHIFFITPEISNMYYINRKWYLYRAKDEIYVQYDFNSYGKSMDLDEILKNPRYRGRQVEVDAATTYKTLKEFFNWHRHLKKPEWLIKEEEMRNE